MSSVYTSRNSTRKPRLTLVPKPDRALRYKWHRETLMGNPTLTATQLRGGIYIFDRYIIERGYAEVSSRGMAQACRMGRKTARRVIDFFEQRGLIECINRGETDAIGRPKRARFLLRVGGQARPPT